MLVIGELVLYFKEGTLSSSPTKNKFIFMIDRFTGDNNTVGLKNISRPEQEIWYTSIKNVISTLDYEAKYTKLKDVISPLVYTTYTTLLDVIERNEKKTYKQIIAQQKIDKSLYYHTSVYDKEEPNTVSFTVNGYKPKDTIEEYKSKEISVKEGKVKEVMDNNVGAAKVAASITAGKALNRLVAEKVAPQLPLMVQGYAKTPVGTVVLANIADFAIKQFMPGNVKANLASKAMMEAAMVELMGSFDFETLVNEIVNSVELPVED